VGRFELIFLLRLKIAFEFWIKKQVANWVGSGLQEF
jgi:hypothetical protein